MGPSRVTRVLSSPSSTTFFRLLTESSSISRASESTCQLIKDEFITAERGEFDIKGFGKIPLYFLEGEFPKWGASFRQPETGSVGEGGVRTSSFYPWR